MNSQTFKLISSKSVDKYCGTKAQSLKRLIESGINSPSFFAISGRQFDEYCIANDLTTVQQFYQGQEYNKKALLCLESLPLPVIDIDSLDEGPYMVRSSSIPFNKANTRDFSSVISGAFESYLADNTQEISSCVKKVWSSAFDEKAYIQCKALADGNIIEGLGVVIQKAISPLYSGVIHTDISHITINWVYGHLSEIVSGNARGNTVDIYKSSIGHYILRGTENDVKEVLDDKKTTFCELYEVATEIQSIFGDYQEIEWLYDGKEIWIVQTQDWIKI